MNDKQSLSIEEYEKFNPVQVLDLDGEKILYCTPNRVTQWRARTLFTKEPVTIDWLKAIPVGSRLLDVGANVGMYSIYAARMRACSVFAFEPESQNYTLLNRNIFLNDASQQIRAFCVALSDEEGMSTLYLSDFTAGASCHSMGQEVDFNLQPRKSAFDQGCISMTVDRLIESGAMPVPEFIKIDVDGFEHRVLKGAARTLADPAVQSVIVELNPRLQEHLDAIEMLRDQGFDFDPQQVRGSVRQSGPFEGVAEYVFRRPASPRVIRSTAGGQQGIALAAEKEVCDRVKAAPVLQDPFEHCVLDNILPASLLAGIASNWPIDGEFAPIQDSGRVRVSPAQQGKRRAVFLTEQGLSKIAPERRSFWLDSVWSWLSGLQFRQELIDKFHPIVASRLSADGTGAPLDTRANRHDRTAIASRNWPTAAPIPDAPSHRPDARPRCPRI